MTSERSSSVLEAGTIAVLEELVAGALSPRDLAERTGRAPRTVTKDLARLRDAGLVDGPKTAPRPTTAGYGLVRPLPPVPRTAYDRMVADILPAPLAALARLVVDAVVFRRHFPEHARQPGFVVFGSKGTGKTAVAELVAQALGFEFRTVLRELSSLSPGGLVGRRRQEAGGRWVFDSSEVADLPFVVLDEADKAEGELRREMFRLFGEHPRIVIEGSDVLLRGVPLVVFNAPLGKGETGLPTNVLHEAHFRRSIVCSTHGLPAHQIDELPVRLRRHYADPVASGPLVSLADCTPPGERLPDAAVAVLRLIREVLTTVGRPFVQLEALEVVTLGRAGRLGCRPGDNLAGAVAGVVTDVLTCWETVPGVVEPGWTVDPDAWRRALGDAPGMEEFLAAASRAAEHRRAVTVERAARRSRADVEDLSLTGERARLRALLDEAISSISRVPKGYGPQAAGLRAQLRKLREDAGTARSKERLEEIAANAAPVLSQASDLVRAIYQRRIEIERAQRARVEADRQAKELAGAHRRALAVALAAKRERRREIRKKLAPWRKKWADARRRTTTRPDEDVPRRLVELRVVSEQRERYLEAREPDALERWLARRRRRPEPQRTPIERVHVFFVDRADRRYGLRELSSWGTPAVLEAIDASIEWAAHAEDLYTETGRTAEPPPELGTGDWDPFGL
jgi:hypothetical protein